MNANVISILVLLAVVGCTSEADKDQTFLGKWEARWRTLPESFPGMEDMDFTMSGNIAFTPDSVAITAYGYEGCIFSEDTLRHALGWRTVNDTLHLLNEEDVYGMSYKVLSRSESKIELQLMEDIFLTLTK